jgi:hypothetical protein
MLMASLQSRPQTRPMTMLLHVALRATGVVLHVALRAIGVALPAAAVMGVLELRGSVPEGDFGTFLGAMGLSLLAAAVWSAIDARRNQTGRVATLWIATAFVYYALSGSLFFTVPLLVAAGLGVAVGAAARTPEAKARHAAGVGH